MSCGKPHETDCSQVLAEVWLLLDHECDPNRRRKLEEHLDECGPCLERYGLEEHLKTLLARKCGGEHAPETFRRKLRDAIRRTVIEQAEVTVCGDSVEVEIRQTKIDVHDETG
jgi:mycothiol system anti-sigma-R factor